MRTDIQETADILRSRDGVRARYELRLQPGGETVTTWDTTYHSIGDDPGIPDSVTPQDVTLVNRVAVSLIGDNGTLKIQECFSAAMTTGLTCDLYSRPAIIEYDTEHLQIAWVNGGIIYSALVNSDQLLNNHTVSISDITALDDLPVATYYAVHLISPSEFVIFYIDDGGVRVFYRGLQVGPPEVPPKLPPPPGESPLYSFPMYCPTKVYQALSIDDQLALNYTGACRFDGTIFAYFSMFDGSVQAVRMIEDTDIWSDMYEAVAADLSTFKISKASVYNNKVILSGQFKRVDPVGAFESPYVYGMALSSADGETFAIDRHSLFSYGNQDNNDVGANRFFALGVDAPDTRYGYGGPAFIYYGSGRLGVGKCKYTVASQQYTDTVIKLFGLDGGYNDGWTLKAGNIPASQYESIELGYAADIYMSVPDDTGAWVNWFMLQHGVIVRKSQSMEDGKVETSLEFEPWGASRLADMTWPYYVELQGKQSIRDDCDEWDNLYKASEDGFLVGQFYADFWGEGTCDPREAAASGTAEWTSIDLSTQYYLASNPEISVLPINIKCYGWSRPGHTTNLETGGDDVPGDSNAQNCAISVRLYVKRGEDSLILTCSTPKAGETHHFPRTWYTDSSGYYPVTIVGDTSDGLAVGDIIEKVGMVFTNPNGGDATLNFPERIEIPEVSMHFESYEDTWARVEVEPYETEWNFGSGSNSEWVPTGGSEGDPIVSFGWAYSNNAMVYNGAARIDITVDNSEVPGATCPSWAASGCSGLNMELPEGVLIGEGCKVTATVDVVSVNRVIADNGTAFMNVLMEDGSWATPGWNSTPKIYCSNGSTLSNQTLEMTIDPSHIGKVAKAIRIAGAGRGYAVRYHTLAIEGFEFRESEENDVGQQLQQTGVPVLYLATKPYYTINTEVAAKYRLVGEHSYGGVVALCNNAQNYVCARMGVDVVQIVKYRGGIETILAEVAHTHNAEEGEWIKMKIEDGHITARTRVANVKSWSSILCEYYWTEDDGQLIMEKDISHVGIYAFKDAPWFRITGFDPAMGNVMGILPPGEDFDDLPSSGQIRIEDCVYSYTGKQVPDGTWGGPYQGRNTTDWGSYSYDGESYNGTAIEFIRFEWLSNGSNSDNFDSYLMAVESGFAWSVASVDYKPSITTRGVRIFLKNRGRFFSSQAAGDQVGMSTRVWLTAALTGIAKVSGAETTHSVGSLAFLASTSDVILFEFAASSGHGPLTDRDMLDIVCKLSDAESRFPGDNEISSATMSPSTPLQVSP